MPQKGKINHTQALLGKCRGVLTSSEDTVERWKKYLPSLQKSAAEAAGVLESISVAEITETFLMARLMG